MSSQTLTPAPAAKKKYTPLFRSLTETIRAKKLKRNELLVVVFLLEKTLGFGKPKDRLTTGLIAYSTGIRKDRVKSAINGVLATGLFERKTSPRFEYEYQIGQKFLDQHIGHFFAPALPKNGTAFRKTEIFSEIREHTALYPDKFLPSHKPLPLHCQDNSLEDFDFSNGSDDCSGQNVNNIQKKTELNHFSSPPIETAAQRVPAPCDWHLSLKLPNSLQPANQAAIVNIFKQGTPQQARDTLIVFDDMERKGLVRHTPFLLKTLALASQKDQLIMPDPHQPITAKKATLPPVPNALDDSLTRYAEKHGFSEPRQAADFTYYYYRDLLRKERRERLAKAEYPMTVFPPETACKKTEADRNTMGHQATVLEYSASDLAMLM
jgi:hypothetical protein